MIRISRTCACVVVLAAAAGLTAPEAHAQTFNLGFSSLPSAQGWSYAGNVAESSAFSVSGNTLFQNTVGKGLSTDAYYALNGVVDLTKPFSLSVRVRVTADEPNGTRTYGFGFGAESPTNYFAFSVENGVVFDHNTIAVSTDTSVFHDYRLDGDFSTGVCKLYIDGANVANGTSVAFPETNTVFFGDSTPTGGNANAQITQFSFANNSVGAPEPSTLLLISQALPFAGALLIVRRRRNR
jgi:hypothetical protein